MQALEEMQAAGHRPDVGVYNCVIEALSASGVLAAQLKAAQLFLGAVRSGQLRPMLQCGSDMAVIALTVGSALLAALQWLADLRRAPFLCMTMPWLLRALSHIRLPHALLLIEGLVCRLKHGLTGCSLLASRQAFLRAARVWKCSCGAEGTAWCMHAG